MGNAQWVRIALSAESPHRSYRSPPCQRMPVWCVRAWATGRGSADCVSGKGRRRLAIAVRSAACPPECPQRARCDARIDERGPWRHTLPRPPRLTSIRSCCASRRRCGRDARRPCPHRMAHRPCDPRVTSPWSQPRCPASFLSTPAWCRAPLVPRNRPPERRPRPTCLPCWTSRPLPCPAPTFPTGRLHDMGRDVERPPSVPSPPKSWATASPTPRKGTPPSRHRRVTSRLRSRRSAYPRRPMSPPNRRVNSRRTAATSVYM